MKAVGPGLLHGNLQFDDLSVKSFTGSYFRLISYIHKDSFGILNVNAIFL